MKTEPPAKLIQLIEKKNILFLASKKKDYIRIVQEVEMLERYGRSCKVYCYTNQSYLLRMLKLIFHVLCSPMAQYDIIYISFLPQLVVPFFSWKWRGKTVVTDFFVSAYDTLVCDRKKIKRASIAGRLVWWLDKRTIEKSDYLVADTQTHADYFAEEFSANRKEILVWYLTADRSIYHGQRVAKPERWRNKFVVLYFGSILPLQGVHVVLDAVKLSERESGIQFVIVGPVSSNEIIANQNVEYFKWLPQKRLAEQIGQADLCLAGHFSGDIQKARRTIPGKAYIYEAMGKPMILGENAANHEIFEEDRMHSFVEMGNAKALADLILKKYKAWQEGYHAYN